LQGDIKISLYLYLLIKWQKDSRGAGDKNREKRHKSGEKGTNRAKKTPTERKTRQSIKKRN